MREVDKVVVQNIKNEAQKLGISTQDLVLDICRSYLKDERIDGDG